MQLNVNNGTLESLQLYQVTVCLLTIYMCLWISRNMRNQDKKRKTYGKHLSVLAVSALNKPISECFFEKSQLQHRQNIYVFIVLLCLKK